MSYNTNHNHLERILITGSLGQLGTGLARALRKNHGDENVIMTDIVKPTSRVLDEGPFLYADILDFKQLREIVVNKRIDTIVHFSALLSAIGEKNVPLAIEVNINGVNNILELAKQFKLKVFIPSSIAAFGPDSPLDNTPDHCVQRPKTIYGVSKVYTELLGEYYHDKFNVDFRCLRFPGIISSGSSPGGGTTDYAISIFHEALKSNRFECYLSPDTLLPMMYMDDCIRSITEFLDVPSQQLPMRSYNISACSFTPQELANSIKRFMPDFTITYKPDFRQKIAENWPRILDDSNARRHWNWRHHYDIHQLVTTMLTSLNSHLNSPYINSRMLNNTNCVRLIDHIDDNSKVVQSQ